MPISPVSRTLPGRSKRDDFRQPESRRETAWLIQPSSELYHWTFG
jgi:hypothetical protein